MVFLCRRYVPELKHMPLKYLFTPWKAPPAMQKKAQCVVGVDYPKPMVDHVKASRYCKDRMNEVKAIMPDPGEYKVKDNMPDPGEYKYKVTLSDQGQYKVKVIHIQVSIRSRSSCPTQVSIRSRSSCQFEVTMRSRTSRPRSV